jgi:predicted phage terminase large subunit-like protein
MKAKKYNSQISADISRQRREIGALSPQHFAKVYLQHHCRLPFSRMHEELFGLLKKATDQRNFRLAVAAPRGHAKSTAVSLVYVLWCICYGTEQYIVIISNTADQSVDLLKTIKDELESNPLLIQDFPHVTEPPGLKPGPERWRMNDIITRNEIKVIALGAGQKIRGRKHKQYRPTLIILDDIENEMDVTSAEQRESKMAWFKKAVLKAGTTALTNVIVVGTLLHFDSLLSQLLDGRTIPGWTARKYQAVESWSENESLWQHWQNIYTYQAERHGLAGPAAAKDFYQANRDKMLEGTEVLWPQREDYYQLMEIRLTDGRASFDSEKQNEPVDPQSCTFDINKFRYWDDQYSSADELLAKLGGDAEIYGACDPSLGMQGKARDFTAVVTLLMHKSTGHLYVLDAEISKKTPSETISAIIEYYRIRKFKTFGLETNQFQDFMASELQRVSNHQRVYIPIVKIKHSSDKLGRFQLLEPLISTGTLRFSRKHGMLLDQLRQFPKAAHDDGPDALEMAVSLAKSSKGPTSEEVKLTFGIMKYGGDSKNPRRIIGYDGRPFDDLTGLLSG